MSRSWLALAALAVVLAVPFVARSRRPQAFAPAAAPGTETLVVLTPHNEAVRFEFSRAFRQHMATRGRRVDIDWRAPGGAAEISRYLASEYTAAFQRHWTGGLGRRWSAAIASGFMARAGGAGAELAEARREFLTSQVGCGIDLLFGGGTYEHIRHAEAGRLVDAGLIARHPEIFGPGGIPQQLGGQANWDLQGRWMGTCLSSFGICFNQHLLSRLGLPRPSAWEDLADKRLHGQLALADPTRSGSIAKAFETVVQAQMQRVGQVVSESARIEEGWGRAMRLIRRMGGNARYFTDASSKIALDVANGDAAAGMCIDFYGRFQSETTAALGDPGRVGFVAPRGESALEADPIALLRGAPHRELAVAFIEFVMSEAGQKIWGFRRGTPGGPHRYSLRRLPILPRLYDASFTGYRADPDESPYQGEAALDYHEAWTGPLFGAMSFVIRTMCVDVEAELQEAYRELAAAGFPPRASAVFDDLTLVDYATVAGPIRAALKSSDPLQEAAWARRLAAHFRDLYRRTSVLARQGL